MIIKENEFTKINTSFFKSFTPFGLNGSEATDQIANMISYNVVPKLDGVTLNYDIGAANVFNFTLSLKNLTTNVLLDISIDHERYFQITPQSFVLQPEETRDILISVDNSVINQYGQALQFLTQITVNVKNIKNGTFAKKRLNVEQLQQVSLPNTIDIT